MKKTMYSILGAAAILAVCTLFGGYADAATLGTMHPMITHAGMATALGAMALGGVTISESGRDVLSSRAVVGMYYEELAADSGAAWLDGVSNYFTSDQPSETYAWLGMPPALREWVGQRQSKQLSVNGVTLTNVHYEATIDFLLRDLRRDKTPQIRARIGDFGQRGQSHFAKLLSALVNAGLTEVCYDGQYFFDTDHSEGSSGTQSNKITTDISALPAAVHGVTTAPSPEEMQQAILKSIVQMAGFVDDQGEPLNENARQFLVMCPVALQESVMAALSMSRLGIPGSFNLNSVDIQMAANPRLDALSWTDAFVTFRTDGSIRPLIRQEEMAPTLMVKDETSEYTFDNAAIQIGLDTWRTVGFGRWQGAVYNQMI